MANLSALGQSKVPAVYTKLAARGLADLMNIAGETVTQGAGGGRIKSASPNAYTNIPVIYEKNRLGRNLTAGGQPIKVGNFLLRFPVYHNGSRVNITESHKLTILARGLEPQKVFTIVGTPFDNQGVEWEVEGEQRL